MGDKRNQSEHVDSRGKRNGRGGAAKPIFPKPHPALVLCIAFAWAAFGFCPQAHATGTLIVGVYSTVDAQPLAGVTVTVTEDGSLIDDAVTLPSGEVQFTLAQSLNYTVTASKPGFADSVRDHVNILDGVLTRLTVPLAPDLSQNGTWQGTTAGGLPVSFVVDSDTVTNLSYDADYECYTGGSTYWEHQRTPFVPVVLNWFVFQENYDAGILEDTTFVTIFFGNFTSDTQANGQIIAFVAAFAGAGYATQPCWYVDTWTATKVVPPGAASGSGIEYDLRMKK